jgi:hypothetical protein
MNYEDLDKEELIGELENRNEEKSKSKITLIGVIF